MQKMLLTPISLQQLTINAPIFQVTVLEDRALVQRKAKLNLAQGLWRLKIENVAPILVNKSLKAEFSENYPNGRIDDVRVVRQLVIKDFEQPKNIQQLLTEKKQLTKQLEELNALADQQYNYREDLKLILAKSLMEVPLDLMWNQSQLEQNNWTSHLANLFEQSRTIESEILSNAQTRETIHKQIQNLTNQIENLSTPASIYTAHLETDIMIGETGEYEIIFDYIVPNALWRPIHQVRLFSEGESKINFECQGCVWQNTGEDWNNINLIFSTARPSLGIEPPLLEDDVLNIQDKAKDLIISAREQEIQTTGEGVDKTQKQGSSTLELPGVDDGGEVRNLKAKTTATILSDGKPYRLSLFNFESPANIEYILMAEFVPQVIKKTEQTNTSNLPILAGPVDLISNTEFVGKTSIMFIAPGEKFTLGWGTDGAMRVHRTQETETKKNSVTGWRIATIKTNLFLSNIGNETRVIKTTERVPISELEQVKIKVINSQTTDKINPDDNGFCHWISTLKPYSQLVLNLVYQMEVSPEVKGAVF
jgi:uncharacterized protein (TIGR02231 family)